MRNSVVITLILYALSVLSMATVGVLVPFLPELARGFGAAPAAVAVAISLFSVPSALLATIGGAVFDGWGLRRSLIGAGMAGAAGSLIVSVASNLATLHAGLLVAGCGLAGTTVGAPALMVAALAGGPRLRAMSFWSTYAPTGFAVGLLLAVPFVAGMGWRQAMALHGVLMGAAACGGLLLPVVTRQEQPASARERVRGLIGIFGDRPVVRLGIAVALPNAISYGTSLVAPSYLARVHDVSLAASATTVAIAKIVAMIVGGLVTGQLLARQVNIRTLYVALAGTGAAAQLILYYPGSSFPVAAGALLLWLFAFGGMAGGAMAQLPMVLRDPARGGMAAGLLGQCISLASFATPPLYFALGGWGAYVALAIAGLAVSVVMLPVAASGATRRAAALRS